MLVAQLCPTLCDRLDSSPPGSSVHGILQARILECVDISFSTQGDLPNPEIKPGSPSLQADSLPSELPGKITAKFKIYGEVLASAAHILKLERYRED